jgi:geranylgeranylglycerol-phosphate geranylgeranyltransferase
MTGLRRSLLKLEAVGWMGRPSALIDAPLIVPAGWLAAADPPSTGRMLAAMATAVIAGALTNMANDLLDEEKDKTTAPELPLPSGLLTRPQALVAFVVLVFVGFGTAAIASVTLERFLAGVAVGFLCGFLVLLYSLVKERGLVASVVIASAYACMPLGAWLVAGAGGSTVIPVMAFALLWGLAGNFQAALRDVDSDDEVGNQSIAVRVGPERTLALGAAVDVAASLCILWAAALEDRLEIGIPLVALFLAVLVFTHRAAIGRHGEDRAEGRTQRVRVMRAATLSRLGSQFVLVAVFSVPIALLLAAAVAALLLLLIPGYERRIIGGGLREAMARVPG